jgi:hypothetical protein
MGTQKYPSLMLPNTIKFEYSTICVYSFIYSLAKRQELSVIDVLRQKCALLRSTCPLTEGQSTPKMARRVVRLSPISTTNKASPFLLSRHPDVFVKDGSWCLSFLLDCQTATDVKEPKISRRAHNASRFVRKQCCLCLSRQWGRV